jgi:hypothetical protein
VDSDSDLEDFPLVSSTRRFDHEVPSSSSQSSDYENEESPPPSSTMPRWDCHTLKFIGTLVGDPSNTWRTRSHHQDIMHSYIYTTSDPQSFHEALGITERDSTMEEEYNSLI